MYRITDHMSEGDVKPIDCNCFCVRRRCPNKAKWWKLVYNSTEGLDELHAVCDDHK